MPAAEKSSAKTPLIAKPPIEKPPSAESFSRDPKGSASAPTAAQPAKGRVDDFNLPLVIEIETPEVPPEIQEPSPPIEDENPEK